MKTTNHTKTAGLHSDWCSHEVRALLSNQSPEAREVANAAARANGLAYFRSAYRHYLQSIFSGQMKPLREYAPESAFAAPEYCGDPIVASRRELEDAAWEQASHAADTAVEFWAYLNATTMTNPICSFELCEVLVAALRELRDTRAAYNCVLFWFRLHAHTLPPSWRQLHRCLQQNPGLLRNAPKHSEPLTNCDSHE